MRRREFLEAVAAGVSASVRGRAQTAPDDIRITRIVGFDLVSERPKLVGFYMQLYIGWAITNLYRAEHDPLSNDILIAEGYRISEGYATIPDTPGFGLKINEEKLAANARVRFDLTL